MSSRKEDQKFKHFGIALNILLFILCIFLFVQWRLQITATEYFFGNPANYYTSEVIRNDRCIQNLAWNAGPLQMTLPGNLEAYVGKFFIIYSLSPHPHTITINNVAGPTWDGTSTIVSFAPMAGSGLMFHVISPTKIIVVTFTNVTFS